MPRKMNKQARDLVIEKIQENGFASTDEIVDFVRPFYEFDSLASKEREIRRYVGQLVRSQRDEQGTRTMFLEKTKSEIIDIDACQDSARIALVGQQLMLQSKGLWKSIKKAERRKLEINGQVSLFDEDVLLRELSGS